MDTTDPEITFDGDGVSNHWYEYEHARRPQLPSREAATVALSRVVEAVKLAGEGRTMTACLGLSGGVDSSYLAHLAVELGLRPLVVHFDNGWNSELAVSNIESLVKAFASRPSHVRHGLAGVSRPAALVLQGLGSRSRSTYRSHDTGRSLPGSLNNMASSSCSREQTW